MSNDDEQIPFFAKAGLGGLLACCISVALLGGTALAGGAAAVLGIAADVVIVTVAGLGLVLGVGVAYAYQKLRKPTCA